MNYRILVLVFLVCMAAVPSMLAAGDYLGGDVVLGGAGPKQITQQVTLVITEVPTAAVPLQPVGTNTGSLLVATTPAGATILIDGVQRGISPATIPGLLAGSHTVLLKMDGYQDLSSPVTINAGQTLTYTTTLTPASTAAAVAPASQQKKSPGFEAALGLAALGAVLCIRKSSR